MVRATPTLTPYPHVMNTKERVERLREVWREGSDIDSCLHFVNEESDGFEARHVDSVELGSGRWYDYMLEVIELDKDYYVGLCWSRGLTESQENMYEDDSVYLLEREEKGVTTVEWNTKETL